MPQCPDIPMAGIRHKAPCYDQKGEAVLGFWDFIFAY